MENAQRIMLLLVKVYIILNQSECSLGSNHERRNTKKNCYCEDAEDQIEQHDVSDKKEVFVCDIGFNALNAESMEERHDKVETKGESCKILLLPLLRRKLKSVISDGNCKLRIFFVLKILIVVFLVFSSQ